MMIADPKILILEDNQSDADLLLRELKRSGLIFTFEIVQTRFAFEKALSHFNPDIILSDYALPSFDAVSAFQIKQNSLPNIPFIIVSGIIGEENAVELIKIGVTDYVSKNTLVTLVTKIKRALNDTEIWKDKIFIDEQLKQKATELTIANTELLSQNQEKEARSAELVILTTELRRANELMLKQEDKVKRINQQLLQLNQELEERVASRTRALAESETRFRNMMETIPQIAWTNTIAGKALFYNQRWFDYTGLDPKQSELTGFNRVIHPDDLKNSLNQFRSIRKTHDGGEFQTRARRADGSYRWHLVRLMPIKSEGGYMQLWVGTATDIQELRILQQQKDDFISIASHELKTPITSLKASLQLLDRLKDEPASPMLPMLIGQANKSISKVTALVEDLLNASKANEGQLPIHKKTFVLAKLIDDCCQHVRAEAIYSIRVTGNLEVCVNADIDRIDQVVVNLVNNAIKYAPDSKEININIEKLEDYVKLSVIDKGPGIPPEKLRYIFDRYYRADNSGSRYTGLGLGLYICTEIIKGHDGQIGVESELGAGTTFWFTLPVFNQ